MKVYQVVEFRNGVEYTWEYILQNKVGWHNDEDFAIIE